MWIKNITDDSVSSLAGGEIVNYVHVVKPLSSRRDMVIAYLELQAVMITQKRYT